MANFEWIKLNGGEKLYPTDSDAMRYVSSPTADDLLKVNSSGQAVDSGVAVSSIATQSDLSQKQDTLVSGTNIKTINNTSLLGSGNIDIQGGGGGSYTAGTGIDLTSDIITNTAPVWHGDDVGTFVSPINADQLEGYSLLNLLKLIYPVGSVYMNVNNVNPSSFITGTTWELLPEEYELVAWVRMNTASTIAVQKNVSSVSGTTTRTISFSTPLRNANYLVAVSAEVGGNGQEIIGVYEQTVDSFKVDFMNRSGSMVSPENLSVMVFGLPNTRTKYVWKRTA